MQRGWILWGLITVAGCGGAPAPQVAADPPAPEVQTRGRLISIEVDSQAIAGNPVGIPARQTVAVYLPPGYDAGAERRYPTLYLLHGLTDSNETWTEKGEYGFGIPEMMDQLVATGRSQPMIVVMPSAQGPLASTFFIDSTANGGWGVFLARELVARVDGELRTIASAEGRAIAGLSMGGFGAVRAGMDHPGVFGVVWAMSPCCLAWVEELGPDNPAWAALAAAGSPEAVLEAARDDDAFWPLAIAAAARAFTPDPERSPWYFRLPYEPDGSGGLRLVEEVAAQWRSQFPVERVREHGESLRDLRLLVIDYGYDDQFPHIPVGVRLLADSLAREHIPHVVEAYDGDHGNRMYERLQEVVLPRISRTLGGHRAAPSVR